MIKKNCWVSDFQDMNLQMAPAFKDCCVKLFNYWFGVFPKIKLYVVIVI